MKKTIALGIFLAVFVFNLVGCTVREVQPPETISIETAYGPCQWGMTKEEVFEALSIREDQVLEEEDSDIGKVIKISWDEPVYDQPVPYLAFLFDPIEQVSGDTTPRLIEIRFLYDKNAKLEDIWDSIKKVYGESSQFTVRDEFSDSYSTWAKSRQTLLEAFTPSAKEAMREVCKDIIYSSEDEFEESLNVPLVEVSSFGEEYKSDSLYMIQIMGSNQVIAELLNARS